MSLPTDISDSPIRRAPPVYRAPPPIDNFSYTPPPSMSSPAHALPLQPPPSSSQIPSSFQQSHSIPPSMTTVGLPILEPQPKTKEQYKECVNEFQQVMTNFMDMQQQQQQQRVGGSVASRKNSFEQIIEEQASQSPSLPPRKQRIDQQHRSISRENSMEQQQLQQQQQQFDRDENKENNQNIMTSSPSTATTAMISAAAAAETEENKLSKVKEGLLIFNRFASEEEAEKLIPSPLSKATIKNQKNEKVRIFQFYLLSM
jgi:hypothetical protein